MANPKQLADATIDEIALEGMDGLTIEGLWIRLADRFKFPLPLHDKVRTAIWHFVSRSPVVQFYELAEPRPPLRTFDRLDYDTQTADIADGYPFTVYAFREVDLPAVPLRGSCQDFDTRREMCARTELWPLRLDEVCARWPHRLVMAGTQGAREAVLIPATVSVGTTLSLHQYCLLERIGRSRWNGEATNGRFPLNEYNQFHLRKPMIRNRLLAKQLYYEKVKDHNNQGLLLHLPRFFRIFKPKAMLIVERIVEALKRAPNGLVEYSIMLQQFDEELHLGVRKVLKSPLLHQFVINDVKVLYRRIHPDAPESEWRTRAGTGVERHLRCLRLRNPHLDVANMWSETDAGDADGSDNECGGGGGLFDQSQLQLNEPLLRQAYTQLDEAGCTGLSQKQLAQRLGLPKLNIRMVVRNLQRMDLTDSYMTDLGRQRSTIYILKRYKEQLNAKMARDIAGADGGTDGDALHAPSQACDNLNMASDLVRTLAATETDCGEADMDDDELMGIIKQEQPDADTEASFTANAAAASKDLPISVVQLELRELPGLPNVPLRRKAGCMMTTRMAKRLNIIQQAVRRYHVIDDVYKVYHTIHQVERRIGHTDEMCRRSIKRLINQLCDERKIRLWLVRLQFKTVSAVVMYMTQPDIGADSMLMQRQVEKEKVKFLLRLNTERARMWQQREAGAAETTATTSKAAASRRSTAGTAKPTPSHAVVTASVPRPRRTVSLSYGVVPKFIRMRTLHEFLYYLVYAQPPDAACIPTDTAIKTWRTRQPLVSDFDDLRDSMSQVYDTELDWRTFVPPLQSPTQAAYTQSGWVLFSDALLRMPLSVFVNVHNHNYEVEGLETMLLHPVRRHFLLSLLPAELRESLLGSRKYVFHVTEVLRRCCSLGLLQMGPQRAHSKEHLYIYVNRRASLADTTGAEPAYVKTAPGIEFPKRMYEFDSAAAVAEYWHDLHAICTSTKLNRRVNVNAADQVMLIWDTAPAMVATWQTRTAEEARELDTGEIPGDGRGAGGLDASMFAHLQRNWTFARHRREPKVARSARRVTQLTQMQQKRRLGERKASTGAGPATAAKSMVLQSRRLITSSTGKASGSGVATTSKSSKPQKKTTFKRIVRVHPKRRLSTAKALLPRGNRPQVYDEVDQQALRRMVKLRVDWSHAEDNFLLLARAAFLILCPNFRRLTVSSIQVRDLLHWHCGSLNKTSRACQRRIVYMLKHPAKAAQFHLSVQEARELPEVRRRFGPEFYGTLRAQFPLEANFVRALKIFYVDLVYLLLQNVHRLTAMSSTAGRTHRLPSTAARSILPDTAAEFHKRFATRPEEYEHQRLRFAQPRCGRDVEVIVIGQLIHSSCCCALDKQSNSVQLYDIYKTYTDDVLTDAMAKMRDEQLISANKMSVQTRYVTRSLPLNSTPYHLSMRYNLQMLTPLPVDLMEDAWMALTRMTAAKELSEFAVRGISGGYCLLMAEILHKFGGRQQEADTLRVTIEIPSPIIVFDSSHCTVNKSILERIKNRFCSIFDFVKDGNATRLSAERANVAAATTAEGASEVQGLRTMEVVAAARPKRKRTVTISEEENSMREYHLGAVERLMKMDYSVFHFFCVLGAIGRRTTLSQLTIDRDRRCGFGCVQATANPVESALRIVQRSGEALLAQINEDDQMDLRLVGGDFEIDVWNVLAVFNVLLNRQLDGGSDGVGGIDEEPETADHGMVQLSLDILAEGGGKHGGDDGEATTSAMSVTPVAVKATPVIAAFPIAGKAATASTSQGIGTLTSSSSSQPLSAGTAAAAATKDDDEEDGDRVSKLHDYFFLNSTKVALSIADTARLRQDEWHKTQLLATLCDEHIWPLEAVQHEDRLLADDPFARQLLEHLHAYRELGANAATLVAAFPERGRLDAGLQRLQRERVVLRTGVTEYVWVHGHFAKPWLISTYNLKRLQRETMVPLAAQVMRVPSSDGAGRKRKREEADDGGNDEEDEEDDTDVGDNERQSKRACRTDSKTIGTDEALPAESEAPPGKPLMRLHMKPWLRVNGSLNRRCLDRWLATILMHCISNAGVTLAQMARRFSLMLPTHVRDMVDYMCRLGWVRLVALHATGPEGPACFWDAYNAPVEAPATDLDAMDIVYVQVETDAISKLITFIGDKKYSAEFI